MHATIMRDFGIDKASVREQDSSKRGQFGWAKGFFSFRKMFWEYLEKLHVPFFDQCCEDASENNGFPVRWNVALQRLEYFNGTVWGDIIPIVEATTTTTTAAPTTTTTTTAPSDIRLKTNIQPTGRMITVPEYTWEWNNEAKRLGLDHYNTTGVMAQELLEVAPHLVSVGEDGYYRVNYGGLN
jgi:hypothetical protein